MFKPSTTEKIQDWNERILRQQHSGLSIACWCKENQVAACQFHYWKRKLFPKQIVASSFTELANARDIGITIEYNDLRVHLDPHFDAATLKRCLSVLRERKC